MDYYCVLLSLFLIFPIIDSNTCPSTNGVHVFGESCDFMCHCKDNEQCDRISGGCSSGCAKGWFGPGCQYRDLAADGRFLQSYSSANLATDGNQETCFDTQMKDRPAWKIYLKSIETITELHIVTKSDTLEYFENFEVLVQNRSSKEYKKEKCHKHAGIAPKSKQFIVLCNSRLVGDKVTIKLTKKQKQKLVICDVKINGGRNLAFKRITSQISVYPTCKDTCTSEKAVNGLTEKNWWQCTFTNSENNPWWRLDIGILARVYAIKKISIQSENVNLYTIGISNSTDASYFVAKGNIAVNTIGRFINVNRKENNKRVIICEIFVYGDCQDNMCGYDCQKPCNCRDATILGKMSGNCYNECMDKSEDFQCNIFYDAVKTTTGCEGGKFGTDCSNSCNKNCKGDQEGLCNNLDGNCFGGCIDGWEGNMCDQACEAGFFGKRCEGTCSQHCEGGITKCNHTNGHCKDGCKPGWIEQRCIKPCDRGYFGHNCLKKCSDHCKYANEYCKKVDGNCKYGCKDGWKAPLCDQACEAGFFGKMCESTCSQHCEGGNTKCNHTNGHCQDGCKPGWTEPRCIKSCDTGFYGQNCEEKCTEHCAGGSRNCNTTTGNCEMGCQPGWIGLRCFNACPSRKFGAECKEDCVSTCKHGLCDHVSGDCHDGCKRGYKGNKCERKCGHGTFGENCQEKCSTTCKNGVCSHLDGGCSNGCKPGYHGNNCEQKCRDGTFGKECKGHCSTKCNNNTCDHVTGNCTDGYKPGYKGNTCKEISDKILSDTKPCTGCHETPKPNIVLICVGILCAIVVVYATVITILFKLKDGTNVSCSGRSNDDAITNITNKTETVTAEAATEATTELARVNINAVDDESHQYTDLTPDTKDVEATYETIQLE